MTNLRGAKALAAAVVLLLATSACADDGNDAAPSASPTPPSPSSSTTATRAPTKSERASQAASAVARKYFATIDRLGQSPKTPLRELHDVATSIQMSAQANLIKQQRSKRQRQSGETKVAELKVQSVNLDNSEPGVGKVPTVTIDVCWDVSQVDVVDSSGKSIVSSSRPDRGWTRYTVANYHWSTNPDDGWRIASGQDLKQAPCPAS